MKIYGICPLCDTETEIKDTKCNYQQCMSCGKIYSISSGIAKVRGTELDPKEKKEVYEKAQKLVEPLIDSYKFNP